MAAEERRRKDASDNDKPPVSVRPPFSFRPFFFYGQLFIVEPRNKLSFPWKILTRPFEHPKKIWIRLSSEYSKREKCKMDKTLFHVDTVENKRRI